MMPTLIDETRDVYYQALLNRDPQYLGTFYAGVKTTAIFCISTCRARKPKKENVVFYATFKEALVNGFRPCKICRPTELPDAPPMPVQQAIALVKERPWEKISDALLRDHGIGPDGVRRWFKKHRGVTFHAFQRMYRINNAYQELQEGKRSTAVAFDAGYASLSGFGYTYKKLMGRAPTKTSSKNVILIERLTSPLGPMFVCATENGICLLEFTDRKMLETEFRDLQKLFNANIMSGENDHISQLRTELKEYFDGRRKVFSVALDTPGTAFQQQAWEALKAVSYGTTSTYQQQAQKLNNPNAVRAVARANGHNRVAIVIPCHRVIGKDGHLTGYAGGIERKKWLIDFEKRHLGS